MDVMYDSGATLKDLSHIYQPTLSGGDQNLSAF